MGTFGILQFFFCFTPINNYKTCGKINWEQMYVFGIYTSDLQSCRAQERCASVRRALNYPARFCGHTSTPLGAKMLYQEKKTEVLASHFSSLSFPLSAGSKYSVQEGEWMAGRTHGVGASVVKIAKLPTFTGQLHPGNFMQNQRKRKVFPKGKTVDVNENICMWMYACVVHVLNHLDDNRWTHFNGGPLKCLHYKYKNPLLEK